jgi:hypothetical protein
VSAKPARDSKPPKEPKAARATERRHVGIDLGTTNCALAHLAAGQGVDETATPNPETLEIAQVIRPGEVTARPLLPSFIYLAGEHEVPEGALDLPWASSRTYAVGDYARDQGGKVPARLISSAKSWLCHPGVDRRGEILPWKAAEGVKKMSPVEASAAYLEHMAGAWHLATGTDLSEHAPVLCVPASFDAAARDLTVEAAALAGLVDPVLLEEPQAALYAWIGGTAGAWRKQVKVGDIILVVDVGGGTTDLSLIAVSEERGDLVLTRVAVGEHILLGGDNMDLALAHQARTQLAAEGTKLDGWQFLELGHGCRAAKEQLLWDPSIGEVPVAIKGRGSKLVGGTIRTSISREVAERVLLEGFFPRCDVTTKPNEARSLGLAEWGLSYASDTAITAHLAAFLARHAKALGDVLGKEADASEWAGFAVPSAVMFNGGVFRSAMLKQRVLEVVGSWVADAGGDFSPPRELEARDVDRAVALGGAYYSWVREGGAGLRIRGGTARSYYVGVEAAMPAVPGMPPPVDAVCVAPFGMEEGTTAELEGREFGVVVGQPMEFRFFASSVRRGDKVGAAIESWDVGDELSEMPPLKAVLQADGHEGALVPVRLHSVVTEVGTLQVWCVERDGPGKWKLEFDVRLKEG